MSMRSAYVRLLSGDSEGGLLIGVRAVARVDLDLARLHDELPIVVVKAEVALVERERDRFLFALGERQALEAAQAAHRLRETRNGVVDVELRHVIAGTSAGVGDVHARG